MNAAVNIAKRFFGRFPAYTAGLLAKDSAVMREIERRFNDWADDVVLRKKSSGPPPEGPHGPGGTTGDPSVPW